MLHWRLKNPCAATKTKHSQVNKYIFERKKERKYENPLLIQQLGLDAFTANGQGSTPGCGTKIPQVPQHGQTKPQKDYWGGNNSESLNTKQRNWKQAEDRVRIARISKGKIGSFVIHKTI